MRRFLPVLVLLLIGAPLQSQETPATPSINVFLDCQASGCDTDHFRTEIPFVSWVRDRTAADVHLLITSQGTGSGGTAYTLHYMGLRSFAADTLDLQLAVGQTTADAVRRDQLTNRIAQGLLTYAINTPAAAGIRLSVAERDADEEVAAPGAKDPWNSWVFSVGLSGDANGEARSSSLDVELDAEAQRVTPEWRFEMRTEGSYERERRELSDGTIRFITRNYYGEAQLVKAVARLWSAGLRAETGNSTFRNQDLFARVAPTLEYSFFPYEEFSRRQMTLQYSAGVNYYDYTEETLFDKTVETVYDEQLRLSLRFQQPWGFARMFLEGEHYFHDTSRYSLSTEASVDIRLLRGLSAEVGASYSRVHNQLYIQKGDATDEEILLERLALGTDYEYSVFAGINFTFGSIFNNVVNRRID